MPMRYLFLASLAAFILAAPAAYAADASSMVPSSPVRYMVVPEHPGPRTNVTIVVEGIGSILGDSLISWEKDGAPAASGYGVSTYTFTTAGLGDETTIGVSIASPSYGTIRKNFTFNPSLINLVWEAQTSIPPLYRGKALASPGSTITVHAFPSVRANGAAVPPSELSFQWKLNDKALPAQSGVGRSSLTFDSNQLHQSETVSVAVYARDGAPAGGSTITVPLTTPALVFYPHDPLRGVRYEQALQSPFSMAGSEMTVRAEPFYFSTDGSGALQYSWRLNGAAVTGPATAQGELTLRQTGEGQGSALIAVSLQNTNALRFLQSAQNALTVNFGQTASAASLFGL